MTTWRRLDVDWPGRGQSLVVHQVPEHQGRLETWLATGEQDDG